MNGFLLLVIEDTGAVVTARYVFVSEMSPLCAKVAGTPQERAEVAATPAEDGVVLMATTTTDLIALGAQWPPIGEYAVLITPSRQAKDAGGKIREATTAAKVG